MFYLEKDGVAIRKFKIEDIENKVKWINNPENNKYLHYDLPLEYDKTVVWFERIKHVKNRLDAVMEYKGVPVGLVGLLNIDNVNRKAEYYVCMGEGEYRGKGIASIASKLIIDYAFSILDLNKIYLYTEEANTSAQRLFERLKFKKEGLLIEDLIHNGRKVNRFVYGILKEDEQ